ncbi:amidase [Mesorhizobium sp. LHD-90]|uniref:amidase n=1 Tax=Mesorhizobium sp. LHD-90 TaxID=3071414 RepID=UPI0027E0C91E|nr:amidase [Mesorhizobium sp. LHD-90]MDQ6432532.1 amidase [Mesorhizobium sp. LHD-90]
MQLPTALVDTPLIQRPAPTVIETRRAVEHGETTVSQAIAACRARIHSINGTLGAFTTVNEAEAVASDPRRPLAGIAIGVKDLYDTAGMTTSYGSPIYHDHVPAADAALVASLRELGGHVAGKTVTTEFAWRQAGPTVNPWNTAHTPGGSSSGTAAAVAAGLVPLAIGTQTFGSVIRPAAFCGVVGFKPSYGLLSLAGVRPLSPALDHAGLFARSVQDITYVFRLLTAAPANEPATGKPPRLLLLRGPWWNQASATQQALLEQAAAGFVDRGATVEQAELPGAFNDGLAIAETILCQEAAENYASLVVSRPGQISRHMKELVARGQATSNAARQQAFAARSELLPEFAKQIDGYDAVLTLPALGEAPLLEEGTGNPGPCVLWTLLGAPALALPVAAGAGNLPLGLQLVGRSGSDQALLSTGAWCAQT